MAPSRVTISCGVGGTPVRTASTPSSQVSSGAKPWREGFSSKRVASRVAALQVVGTPVGAVGQDADVPLARLLAPAGDVSGELLLGLLTTAALRRSFLTSMTVNPTSMSIRRRPGTGVSSSTSRSCSPSPGPGQEQLADVGLTVASLRTRSRLARRSRSA